MSAIYFNDDMMEESSDESGELVDKEEAVSAEKHYTSHQTTVGGIAPPAPLPSFMTSPNESPAPVPTPATPAPIPIPATPASPPVPNTVATTIATPVSPSSTTPVKPGNFQVQSPSVSTSFPAASSSVSPVALGGSQSPVRPPVSLQEVTAPGAQITPFEASRSITVPEMEVDTSPVRSPQGPGLFGWLSGNKMISRVVEKTKSSVESMITTLDPGMKEVIKSGGDIDILVTSAKESKISAVREAFQLVFGRATVIGKESQATTAAQPVGFTAGLKGAQERIQNLRQSANIPDDQPIVSLEGFIVEMLPDRWYEMSCFVLQDPIHRIDLQTFSQPSPIPAQYILKAQDRTPKDYPLRWAGLSVTIGQIVEEECPHIGHVDWQSGIVGVSRRESLFLAAKSLAYMYRQRLPTQFVS